MPRPPVSATTGQDEMLIETHNFEIDLLSEYATIPIAFEVRSILQVEALENG
jgi:hypothetical protein